MKWSFSATTLTIMTYNIISHKIFYDPQIILCKMNNRQLAPKYSRAASLEVAPPPIFLDLVS
jgi:hypothetical protein